MNRTVQMFLGLTGIAMFALSSSSFGKVKGVPDSEVYRFTMTFGWDLAQGAIPPSQAPNDPHFQYIEKKLKTVPLTQPYDWQGGKGYEQSVRMQMSGGKSNIPEALQLFTPEFTTELINSGVLLPLDDLLPKYAPLVWKALSKEEWDLVRSFAPDKKIYFLPVIQNFPRTGFIRKDWLAAVGINKVPETKEELLAAYRAFKTKDANGNGDPNDEIPVSGREGMRWCDDLFVMHGVSMLEGYPQWRWDAKKKEMVCDQVSPEMKNALTFIAQLVSEGLMDRSMPIRKSGDWFAMIENDKVGHYFQTLSGVPRRLAMRQTGANPDAEWVYMPNVKVDGVEHQKNYSPGFGPIFGITTMARDPKRLVQWFDWFGSPEGQTYSFFGIEGLNYKKVDGKIVVDSTVTPVSNKHLYNMIWADRGREVYGSMPFGDILLNIYDAAKDDYRFIDNLMMPASVYEGFEDYSPANSKLYQEKCSKMVLGELPMSAWDDYVKEWKQKGGDEVTKRVTQWYKKVHNIK